MKFALLTYQMARNWDLDKVIDVAKRCGFAGVEFRADFQHRHGVELESSAQQRTSIRNRMQDAYLEIVGISTSCRFESPDPAVRKSNVESAKRYVELAGDLGTRRIRVFGNNMPPDADRQECLAYVAESLREVGETGAEHGVDVLLEMHGDFNFWGYAPEAVRLADHPNVGLIYNCDVRDLVDGRVAPTWERVADAVRHIHLHYLTGGFPYEELFRLLVRSGYTGYLSAELGKEVPDPEDYLALYALACHVLQVAAGPGRARTP